MRGVRSALRVGLLILSSLGCSSRDAGSERPPGPSGAAEAGGSASTRDVFTGIYGRGTWGTNDAGVGTSGAGSTLQATAVYRAFLQQFLKDHAIRSVVDAGCGDWEFSQAIDWTGIDYRGFDIV